jgi:uncharacterized protein (DUF2336 family)
MSAALALIPEIQDALRRAAPRKRGELASHIADLFAAGADRFGAEHVELFDQLLLGIVAETEMRVRADLASRLAPIANAPPALIGSFARDTEIRVAAPVLLHSPALDDATLIEIARMRGQPHLFAISGRRALSPLVTDIIVRRGDREVVRELAGNADAAFSDHGFLGLVKRASTDVALAIAVGRRNDLPRPYLQRLLIGTVDMVREAVLAGAPPERRSDVENIIAAVTGPPKLETIARDFAGAQRVVLDLHAAGKLNEVALQDFAREHKYEEAVAALAAMTGVPIADADRMVMNARPDSVLILCKALAFDWPTLRAMLALRLGSGRAPSSVEIAQVQAAFDRLDSAMAQRVLGFWQTRG